jgi:hypothetical protein
MAKRTGNSSVNSSIRAGTKTQETGFGQLLELQKISNEHLGSIADAIADDSRKLTALAAIDTLAAMEQKKVDKTIAEENDTLHGIEKGQKELIKLAKEGNARSAREAAGIAAIAQSMRTFKTFGEKLSDMKKGFSDKFGKGNIGRTALSAVNVGGLLNKKIAQGDFVKQQKLLGSTKSDKELKKDFGSAQKASKDIKSNAADIEKFKKDAGGAAGPLTDEEMAKFPKGKELLAVKQVHTQEYAKHDIRASTAKEADDRSKESKGNAKAAIADKRKTEIPISREPKSSPEVAKEAIVEKRKADIPIPIKIAEVHTPSPETAKKDLTEKRKIVVAKADKSTPFKIQEQQVFLLKQLVNNTKPVAGKPRVAGAGASGGDAGGGMLSSLAGGIGSLGDALAKLGKGAGAGLQGLLEGLGKGFASLANPATIIGMGAFTLAAMGIGKALEMAAPAIAAFAPVLMKVAEVVGGVFIEAIKAIPEILKSIGDVIVNIVTAISDAITGIMDSIVTSIERLGAVDGSNLLAVGAGLVAVGAGMAAFGAGGAVAGVANLVTGFLGAVSGQKSPVEQLEQIASYGPGLSQAGIGIEKLSAGLASFGSKNGSKIASMSEQTLAMKEKGAGASNIVSAPTVNNNVKQTAISKVTSNVRTHESSVDRYFGARAVY